ncbi:MAG: nitronate monooxygenase [Pseudomonadales bacterium]|nr:nitronate monooxygenase [Pseudomonadales bacterium]
MLITTLFNIKRPLIQSPMAGAQDSKLCIAVSKAGALGSLPCAMLNTEMIEQEVLKIRSATKNPINLNFFCHQALDFSEEKEILWRQNLAPYYKEHNIDAPPIKSKMGRHPFNSENLSLIERLKPEVISFHFGLPEAALWDRLRDCGAKLISTATTLEEALYLESQGVDAVISQGLEAGGHRGHFLDPNLSLQLPNEQLLARLVEHLNIPVISAGGIFESGSVKAAMDQGAAGVQVGTSYLLCHESRISSLHRQALQSTLAKETALTNLFSGRPARGIVNRLMKEVGPLSTIVPDFPMAGSATLSLRKAAEKKGSVDFTPLWSGVNNQGCREISATEMTQLLVKEII